VAGIDASTVLVEGRLQLEPWLKLSAARRRNVVRRWLAERVPGSVPESLLDRLAIELPRKHTGRWPAGAGELRLHDAALSWLAHRAPTDANLATSTIVDLSVSGRYTLAGWGGKMEITDVEHGGVEAGLLTSASVRARCGAEQFQSAPASTARSLKKQFQARGVPAWERDGPLVWLGDRLAFVAGLGIDARCLAPPGVPQRALRWIAAEGEASGSAG
jgi:tRNA(Ile)-lysidine synthase